MSGVKTKSIIVRLKDFLHDFEIFIDARGSNKRLIPYCGNDGSVVCLLRSRLWFILDTMFGLGYFIAYLLGDLF